MSDTGTISPQRSIGGMAIPCTVEELHNDTLTITQHPVETGAAISDHAYVNPAQVLIRAGWTNSSADAAGDPSYVISVYNQLLAMQKARQPLEIVTGKRLYENMLIEALGVTTDAKTETALMVTATCREVLTATVVVAAVPDPSVQQTPQKTAATQARGAVQPVPVSITPAAAGS